ncbi:MAG TPA: alpha/beta fold hydrolase [Bdellovibrio sp.]|nr:alpha/beta fold hydrolase [Bdellovibrio sp.]
MSQYTKLFVAIVLVTFLAACSPNSQHNVVVPSLSTRQSFFVQAQISAGNILAPDDIIPSNPPVVSACDRFIQSLPSDYIHGFLKVPENKEDPQSPLISVFYYGKLVDGQTPIVFFNGGPGEDSHGDFRTLYQAQKTVPSWNFISFIYIDQRGNGCSSFYPQGSDPATLARLRNYGSRGIVNDAEAVRVKLIGDKPWKAFGQSYGAFVAHRYATLYPKNLVSAHSHGGVITSSAFDRLKGRIGSQNRVLAMYFADYPSDEVSLLALNQYVNGKCFTDQTSKRKTCGLTVIASMTKFLGFTDQWLKIHKWLQVMAPEGVADDKGILQYLQTLYFPQTSDPNNDKSVANTVIDFVDRNVLSLSKENCMKVYTALKAEGADLQHALLNECLLPLSRADGPPSVLSQQVQTLAPDLLTLADFQSSLASSKLPFYLYSGQKDVYVPIEDFAEELSVVKDLVIYKNFLSTGHDGFWTEPLVWSNLQK